MKCERCGKESRTLTFTHKLRRGYIFSKDYSDTQRYAYVCRRCRRVYLAARAAFVCVFLLFFVAGQHRSELFPLFLAVGALVVVFFVKFDGIAAWFHGKPRIREEPDPEDSD